MLEKEFLNHQFHPVILFQEKSIWLDLSASNAELLNVDLSNSHFFSNYIHQLLEKNNVEIAVGGYNEKRNIYKRSQNFNSPIEEERFIHLGIDIWTKENTPVFAPLDATVHSFKNNTGLGNYGPTIILEHELNAFKFYTLYGHLSEASLLDKKIGQKIAKGEQIASLGGALVNGDYPPHLHFQIIKDIQGMVGDYKGVTSVSQQKEDLINCPDPNLILKIPA